MKTIMEGTAHLGRLIVQNKMKLLLGLGALILGGAASLLWSRRKGREEEEAVREEEAPEATFQKRNKRDVYRAPQIPSQNLVSH